MITISEIFGPTIQGEGASIGEPTVFVRTGGCDFRCSWCDTLHAVDRKNRHLWNDMSAEEVFAEVEKLSGGLPMLVTLSGGNPATQNLAPLIALGKAKGYRFAMETQGSVAAEWFSMLDNLTLSPKPPSSKMRFDAIRFDTALMMAGDSVQTTMKIVIADEADFQWAEEMKALYPQLPLYLQACNPQVEGEPDQAELAAQMRALVDRVIAKRWFDVRVLPQLHVYLWGNETGV
ncbi:7-carboxy-7-deazaguanine synthase QueE [Thaumasiovibrio subtropicus]|uniref:7-carboxy-7-deazaguanine synthase QueE n=1 Tax=Thaumasiovibrio subtropicus TaxID=1891207 RepID=UPI000B35384C|nr:7-carboxy-7-deazaguanine synthase QueE [Thaumasiovibrio subtropicus]